MEAASLETTARPAWARLLDGWRPVALLFLLALATYWPAVHGGMLWDDPAHVTRPELRTWGGLWRTWFDLGATQQYYPVLHSAFWVESQLWGDSTFAYHVLNVLLHATNGCLFAMLLGRLWGGRRAGAAWLAGAVFAVHPVCVESVAWITEQKNTLSLLFYLLSAGAYLRFARERRPRDYAIAFGLFLLALGTKSVTATLPAALLVVLWWRQGSLAARRDVLPLLPWFGAALAAGLFTAWFERTYIGADGAGYALSLWERTLLAGRILWFYAGKIVWPVDLAFFYPRWDVPAESAQWLGHLGAAVLVTVVLWVRRDRHRGALAGWLLFGGSLFPALGFFNVFPFAFSYVADHFQYLAAPFAIATVVGGAAALRDRLAPGVRRVAPVVAGLLVAGLAAVARHHSGSYLSNEVLFRANIATNPDSWMAHHILAHELAARPAQRTEAEAAYREALRLNPASPDSHLGLGLVLSATGRSAEAIPHFEAALRLRPAYQHAHVALGNELSSLPGRMPEAIEHFRAALAIRPDYAEAHANLARALSLQPATAGEALEHFSEALRLRPDDPVAHFNLANLLVRLPGRLPEAIPHYEEALRLKPDAAEARANLATALLQLPGRMPEAVAHYEEAVRLNPGSATMHFNLANCLAHLPGREAETRSHYEAALQLQPNLAAAHFQLGNLLARQPDRLVAALPHFEAAARLEPDAAEIQAAFARALADLGRSEAAIGRYEEILRRAPNLAWAHYNLAALLVEQPARRREAIAHCETALRLQPDYADPHNLLGVIHAQDGRLDEARTHWRRAVEIDPGFEAARRNLELLGGR